MDGLHGLSPSSSAYISVLSTDSPGLPTEVKKKPHLCKVCGARFSQTVNLRIHKRIHTGERPYTCDTCAKSFIQLGHLTQHRRLHTGEKPYKCQLCDGVAFIQLSQLQAHQRRTHSLYPNSSSNSAARRTHQCKACDRSFVAEASLHRHSITQHNVSVESTVKPYFCDLCGKGFSQRATLNSHRRTHTGEKPYECDVCSKRYAQLAGLIQHKMTHEAGERSIDASLFAIGGSGPSGSHF